MPIALVRPIGLGEDFVCGPIRGIAMVRRQNTEDINGPRIPAQAAIAEKIDRSAGGAVIRTHQLKVPINVRRFGGTDPGPAGFDWVEIDFKQTH